MSEQPDVLAYWPIWCIHKTLTLAEAMGLGFTVVSTQLLPLRSSERGLKEPVALSLNASWLR
jgi:hypothetical protein